MQIFLQLSGLDIENINQDLDIPEDIVPLRREVVLHEGLLAAAVPEVEHQVTQEPHVTVLHINGGPQPPRVPRDEVGEDDGPHTGLTRPRLSHQQHFFTIHLSLFYCYEIPLK